MVYSIDNAKSVFHDVLQLFSNYISSRRFHIETFLHWDFFFDNLFNLHIFSLEFCLFRKNNFPVEEGIQLRKIRRIEHNSIKSQNFYIFVSISFQYFQFS